MNRHILFASSFALLFASSAAFAQISTTVTGNASTNTSASADTGITFHGSHGTNCTIGTATESNATNWEGNMQRWQSGAFNSDEVASGFADNYKDMTESDKSLMGPHPFMRAMKFLNNEGFRAKVEAPMSTADKQTIETAVADAKTNIATLKALRPQFKTARESNDTTTIHQLALNSRPNFESIRADRKTILEIIAKYKSSPANSPTTGALMDPVYPNPVHLGGDPATITYHVNQAGPVNIIVTDASGNTVQQFSENADAPGAHTFSLNANLPSAGTYYVTVMANGQKSTQKVAAVQ